MSDLVVSFTSQDGIGTISFNRPPANAYDWQFHQEFNSAVEVANADDATRSVIIRSAVEGFFCAGADIKIFAANTPEDNMKMVESAKAVLGKIEASDKPFIACLEGHTLGGGLEIAMACDIRFAATGNYKLGLPEVRLGLLPGNGGSQRLPRIVGSSHAMELLVTGENINPDEAARIGLVNRLFPKETILDETESTARAIARSAPLAVAASKRAVQQGISLDLKDALQLEARLLETLFDTEDAKEGFRSFVEKRAPLYKRK